ncbi:hypothetical protein ACFLR7_00405 [Acidobacteriota bacterium]
MTNANSNSNEKIFKGVIRFNSRYLGMILGLLFGGSIFIATNWLLLKSLITPENEQVIGPHLQLLSQFFIGYRVSFFGSIIGFLYGFGIGTLGGAIIAFIYNKIVQIKTR